MTGNKWIWAALCIVMGSLQAWDSGVLRAPWGIQAIVALAIAVPAGALVMTSSYGRQALSIAVAFALLTVARMASPISLPTLHIVAFIPAVMVFFGRTVQWHGSRIADRSS